MVSDDEAMATIERMVERAAAESRIVKVEGLGFVVADPDTLRFIEACADYVGEFGGFRVFSAYEIEQQTGGKAVESTMFGHAAFERLEGKVDHLCDLLSRARAHVASLNDAEHMMDGLDIVNGEPVGRRAVQPSDGLLAEIDAALSERASPRPSEARASPRPSEARARS